MSTINGLGGPRLPTQTPATTRGPSSTSFLSRVQASVSGVSTPQKSAGASGVSGRDIVSKSVDAARQAPGEQSQVSPEQKVIQDMSRHFVMGLAQGIFGDMGQIGPKIAQDD